MNMNASQQNTLRPLIDKWIARAGGAAAWAGIILWAMLCLVGFSSLIWPASGKTLEGVDYVMPFVCAGLALLHGRLLLSVRRTKKLLRDFCLFCAVFAGEPDKSISDLAAALNLPLEQVMASLGEMCRRGYFNGYIDHQKQRMIFNSAGEAQSLYAIQCPGCGARSAVQGQGGVCRYCGAPLTHP